MPLVCPRAGPHGPGRDCPLIDARERIAFRRNVEADSAARLGMTALIWAEINRPCSSPTRPLPVRPQPIAELISSSTVVDEASPKGVPHHA